VLASTGDSSVVTYGLDLTSKRKALEACEFYEAYQTPVGKAEDGVDAHTEQETLSKSSRYNSKSMSLCKTREKASTEVGWKLTICSYSCKVVEQFVYDALLNMTNIL
jgi:hypothetical protein